MLHQISSHGLIDLEINAVGDTHIDDHHVRPIVRDQVESRAPIRGFADDFDPVLLGQPRVQGLAHHRVIFHQKNFHRKCSPFSAKMSGSVIRQRVPSPIVDSMCKRPWL